MGIREEQKEKRRQEILRAGLTLFIHKGYAATRVSDIAKLAGMSAGLMFHYFESKEKLYEELIRLGTAGPMSVLSIPYKEPVEFFEIVAEQIFDALKNDTFFSQMFVLMGQAFYNEAAPDGVKALLSGFDLFTPTAGLIEEGQKNGTIREGDPQALAMAFWCAVQGIAEQMAVCPDWPCPEGRWLVDILRK